MTLLLETEVTGEVSEHHFICDEQGHEFSIMVKELAFNAELKDNVECPQLGCDGRGHLIGSNDAEVSKDAADLLEN